MSFIQKVVFNVMKILRLSFCFFLLSLSFVENALAQSKTCEIKFRVQTYPPFSIQNADGSWGGLDMEYAKLMADEAGCTITPIQVPWGRGLEMLRVGGLDMMVNVTRNAEREDKYYFIGPQRIELIRLMGIKGAIEPIDTWEKLAATEARYMRQIGAYYGEQFEQLVADKTRFKGELIELPDNQIRLQLLQKNRVAGVFTEELYADHSTASIEQPELLIKHPLIIQNTPVYYAFSKQSVSETQIKQFREIFERLSKTKQYKALGQGR